MIKINKKVLTLSVFKSISAIQLKTMQNLQVFKTCNDL